MFFKSFKTSKLELVVILIGLLCFIATLWYIIASSTKGGASATSANPGGSPVHFLTKAGTAEDRMKFLTQFGWEIEPDPLDARDVIIPAEFDGTLSGYNEMQKEMGFDLEKYKGRRVKKWEYAVTNYPGNIRNVKATLLIYKGRVIGGDISGVGSERFTHALKLSADSHDESSGSVEKQ